MSKLYIEEYPLNETFGCRICLAEDEDAYNAGEVVILGESTFEATKSIAFNRAYVASYASIRVILDELDKKLKPQQ